MRAEALRRAKVWQSTDPSHWDLGRNSRSAGVLGEPIVPCRFLPNEAEGTTPKFRCVVSDGEVIKVKYGVLTAEVHAEVAATRLLRALGFGADEMFLAPKVRCYGCPAFPFPTMWTLDRLGAREAVTNRLPTSRYSEFEWPAVERRFNGAELTSGDDEGWAWHELDAIDPHVGARREEVDALRLVAIFIAHWDNKSQNQRLVCLPPSTGDRCERPFAILQDLGATFGPNKVDLKAWRAAPIWSDATRCLVSMRALPYEGGTFEDAQISERGRALLARQLRAIRPEQIRALFAGARFPEFSHHSADAWAQVFEERVAAIERVGPCPVT